MPMTQHGAGGSPWERGTWDRRAGHRLPVREADIQRALFDHLHWRGAPGVYAFHVPNGGKRNRIEAAIFKGLGARAGVPDVIAVHQGRCYAIELKTEAGRLSKAQAEAIAALERAGAITSVCRGLDAALHTLQRWGLLRNGRWWEDR
jgi:hypothetical protein